MSIAAALTALLLLLTGAVSANAAHARSHHRTRHARRHARRHSGMSLIRFGAPAPAAAGAAQGSTQQGPASSAQPSAPAPAPSGTPSPVAGEAAGRIVSFTEGKLTIALTGGGEVSGMVTEATRIECPGSGGLGDEDGAAPEGGARGMGAGREDGGTGDGESGGVTKAPVAAMKTAVTMAANRAPALRSCQARRSPRRR
jgi:hypothetical protein